MVDHKFLLILPITNQQSWLFSLFDIFQPRISTSYILRYLVHVLWHKLCSFNPCSMDVFHPYVFVLSRRVSKKMVLHDTPWALRCAVWVYGTWGRQDTVLLDIIKIPGHWYLSVVTRSPSLLVLILTLLLPPASIMPERFSLSGRTALVASSIFKIHNLQLSI